MLLYVAALRPIPAFVRNRDMVPCERCRGCLTLCESEDGIGWVAACMRTVDAQCEKTTAVITITTAGVYRAVAAFQSSRAEARSEAISDGSLHFVLPAREDIRDGAALSNACIHTSNLRVHTLML